MPSSLAELLIDLLEREKESLRLVSDRLSLGADLAPEESDIFQGLEQRLDDTCIYIERVLHGPASTGPIG
jgi:hypothetical protein